MRYMLMHKLNARLEAGQMPQPEEIEKIHAMMGEAMGAGLFLGGDGLLPSRERFHVTYTGGQRSVRKGPFEGLGELIGAYAQMKVKTLDEALSWLDRFADVLGDTDIFLGPCTEPWHLGMMPEPEDHPLRFLAVHRMDARAERGEPSSPETVAKMSALLAEMRDAGVLTGSDSLTATKHGARIHFEGEEHSVIDGPFAESKEMISGFAIFELPSLAEAITWGIRWGKTIDVNDVEIRPLVG